MTRYPASGFSSHASRFPLKKLTLALSVIAGIGSSSVYAVDEAEAKLLDELEEIVVTGVFGAKSLEKAPVAISVVDASELEQQIPNSAADILKNVPGVFVNSALGEIRNIVFSRGVSANSLDADGGYFYVSMQEDSVPVELITLTNYGPDYFSRPDIMLDHVEALRGGTASVTGANAPGGIFNYISRTGKTYDGSQIRLKYGLEGDSNPYHRIDLYNGGELKENLYYAVGGFYRESEGARNPGYDMNSGGQIRGNLLWDYDKGSLKVSGKYLNDHNGWFEFIPAKGYSDPKIVTGFDENSSVLPPANPHSFTNPDGSTGSWDGSDLVHSKATALNLQWNHELEGGYTLDSALGFSSKKASWSTGAIVAAMPVADAFSAILPGSFGLPGTTYYRNQSDGSLAAEVFSFSGFDRTLTVNNLPGSSLIEGGVFSQIALSQVNDVDESFFKTTLSKSWDAHDVTIGIEYSEATLKNTSGSAGTGLATLSVNPQMLDITHELPDGTVLQITDPAGFGNQGDGTFDGGALRGEQEQMSAYIADTWQATDKLSIDAAARFEKVVYAVKNTNSAGASEVNGGAGWDNDPLTLWDNYANAVYTTSAHRSFTYTAFTASATYEWTDDFQSYVRFTSSKKAPDMGVIADIDEPAEVATVFPEAQEIEQLEIGLKYQQDAYRVAAFPFYSKLSNVADTQTFTDENGIFYSPPSSFGEIETIGVEIEGDWDVLEQLNVRGSLTLQDAQASGFSAWEANTTSRDDDTLITTPDGDADNNPKIMFRGTATWTPKDNMSTYLTYSYTGERPANRLNAWDLPDFFTIDLGVIFDPTPNWTIQASVNNVTNELGIMSWSASGSFLASLDRQAVTKDQVAANPNELIGILPIQPRSFWLTATYSF